MINNLDKLIEVINNNISGIQRTSIISYDFNSSFASTYKKNLVGFLCTAAEEARCDIRRIDESPGDKQVLIDAVRLGIDSAPVAPISAAVPDIIISQIITDAAEAYLKNHPNIFEELGHSLRVRSAWLARRLS